MFGIGPMEFMVILVIALLVLGPKRMPELARTLGRGLGEFRRASSELRQSLALDDLQNELRDGLAGKNTIKRPAQDDRPAQAGDDLAPGGTSESTSEPKTRAGGDEAAGEANPATAETAETSTGGRPHPGELPLDADPHAHHDTDSDTDRDTESDADREPDPRVSSSGSEAGSAGERGSAEAAAPTRAPSAADSQLGNVPVGHTNEDSTPSTPPTSPTSPTPRTAPIPAKTDKRRG